MGTGRDTPGPEVHIIFRYGTSDVSLGAGTGPVRPLWVQREQIWRRAHPSRFLAAVGRVTQKSRSGGGRVKQRSNWAVNCEVSRSITREHPSEGPPRPP